MSLSEASKAYLKKEKSRINADYQVTKVSTQCPSLDWVFGGQGMPMGRLIEIFGKTSGGKCVALDTLIPVVGKGHVRLEELIGPQDWKTDCDGIKPDQQLELHDQFGVGTVGGYQSDAVGVYYAGLSPLLKVKTLMGNDLTGRPEHRLLLLKQTGCAGWSQLPNIRNRDVLITCGGHGIFGQTPVLINFKDSLSGKRVITDQVNFFKLFGMLACTEYRLNSMVFCIGHKTQLRNITKWSRDTGFDNFLMLNKRFNEFSGIYKVTHGFIEKLSDFVKSRLFTDQLLKANREQQKAFLSALVVTLGQWTGNDLEFTIESHDLAKAVNTMLNNFGIQNMLFETLSVYGKQRWKLSINSSRDYLRLVQEILTISEIPETWQDRNVENRTEFDHPYVKKCLESCNEQFAILRQNGASVEDTDVDDLSRDNFADTAERLRQYTNRNQRARYLFGTLDVLSKPGSSLDLVTEVEDGIEGEAGDLFVPIGSSLATGGLVSHNSTLSLHIAKSVLNHYTDKKDLVVFLDFEKTMDPPYVRSCGLGQELDDDRFIIVRPKTLQEGNKFVQTLIENKEQVRAIIVDSVPAMLPKEVMDRDTDDNPLVGIHARKMTELASEWTGYCDLGEMTVIFINQMRRFIGKGKYGAPNPRIEGVMGSEEWTTPGGEAFKFAMSVRLYVETEKTIKNKVFNPMSGEDDEIPVAAVVKLVNAKNKCGTPFRKGRLYIEFGKGIEVVRTMVELAANQKLIKTSGAWLTLTIDGVELAKAQGQEKLIAKVKESEAIQAALHKALKWDQAEELESQVIETFAESASNEDDEESSVVEQALAQGLIRKQGKFYLYVHNDEEIMRKKLEDLWEAIPDEAKDEIVKQLKEAE